MRNETYAITILLFELMVLCLYVLYVVVTLNI
jgi:hypothetical protein